MQIFVCAKNSTLSLYVKQHFYCNNKTAGIFRLIETSEKKKQIFGARRICQQANRRYAYKNPNKIRQCN